MNAAEEIVKYWYQNQGYFSQESIHLPRNKEIDLLLVRIEGNRVVDRLHVEVQISNRSANYSRSAVQMAKDYHERKFVSVRSAVEPVLGNKYKMVEVRGRLNHGKKDILRDYTALRKKQGVTVIPFEAILVDLMTGFGTNTELRPVIQALQFLKFHHFPQKGG